MGLEDDPASYWGPETAYFAKQLSQNLCATERAFSLSQNIVHAHYAYWAVHDYSDTILHSSLPENCLLQFEGKLYIGVNASTCVLLALQLPSGLLQSFRWIFTVVLSSGAWTRAFGFTVQKLHLPFTPLSKIDVPRPFHGLLHLHSRYTLGKSIRSVAFPRHMDNLQVSH